MAAEKTSVGGSANGPTTSELRSKLTSFFADPKYKESVKNAAAYNKKLMKERKNRLPFLDAHTGVAQNDCLLWRREEDRLPPRSANQVISYPQRRWMKKRRQYLLNNDADSESREVPVNGMDSASNENSSHSMGGHLMPGLGGPPPGPGLFHGNNSHHSSLNGSTLSNILAEGLEDSKDSWLNAHAYEEGSDLPDGELDEPESDDDDSEEYGPRKKRSKGRKSEGPRRRGANSSLGAAADDKPFPCEVCGNRYKTRPGLTYHFTHAHGDMALPPGSSGPSTPASGNGIMSGGESHDGFGKPPHHPPMIPGHGPPGMMPTSSPMPVTAIPPGLGVPGKMITPGAVGVGPVGGPAADALRARLDKKGNDNATGMREPLKNGRSSPQNYCDFCLGDKAENKKTNTAEELVSCSDCGRAAHPTCLQFTDNMILSVKKYRWQCIECKSCGLCGTSDNDEQLLFCDDCDRGYHMYCLKPPLTAPPEGSWSCKICIEEYHTPKPAAAAPASVPAPAPLPPPAVPPAN